MPKNTESLRGVRILVVEDEVLIAEEIRERLSRLGGEIVDVVDSGSAAQRTAEVLRPDLVLMDIRLKGTMTGIEAAEAMRRKLRIPVIFLTAHSDWETVLRAKKSDPYGYILKPFQESDLVATVQVALHRHSLERQLIESERRFEATLSSIGEGVIAADAEGRITFLNPVAEALTQWSLAEAEGRARGRVLREHRRHDNLGRQSWTPGTTATPGCPLPRTSDAESARRSENSCRRFRRADRSSQ
jgi:DNA-binding response OmpR family regulator